MKRIIIVLTALLTMTASTNAMSYEQAREQALFLTDKMAYELNLTEDQYEAAYEVNLDYLMSVNTADDLYGAYWRNRNLDLSYILLDWQYNAFCAASYFYRPLYLTAGVWHFGIYARYPRRNYFYFGRPHFYTSYRGGHSWRMNGGHSWYHGRTFGAAHRNGGFGMRDGFNNGRRPAGNRNVNNGHRNDNYRNNGISNNRKPDNSGHVNNGNRHNNISGNKAGNNNSGNISFGGNRANRDFNRGNSTNRQSSTRTTAPRTDNNNKSSHFGGNRSTTVNRNSSTPNNRFSPSRGTTTRSGMSSGSSTHRSNSSSGSRGTGSLQRSGSSNTGGHFGGRK